MMAHVASVTAKDTTGFKNAKSEPRGRCGEQREPETSATIQLALKIQYA